MKVHILKWWDADYDGECRGIALCGNWVRTYRPNSPRIKPTCIPCLRRRPSPRRK